MTLNAAGLRKRPAFYCARDEEQRRWRLIRSPKGHTAAKRSKGLGCFPTSGSMGVDSHVHCLPVAYVATHALLAASVCVRLCIACQYPPPPYRVSFMGGRMPEGGTFYIRSRARGRGRARGNALFKVGKKWVKIGREIPHARARAKTCIVKNMLAAARPFISLSVCPKNGLSCRSDGFCVISSTPPLPGLTGASKDKRWALLEFQRRAFFSRQISR